MLGIDRVAHREKHTSAYVSMRQHTSAYVSIRQHTSAYVSIRQHTSAYLDMLVIDREKHMVCYCLCKLQK
jgi:hypothetical protein